MSKQNLEKSFQSTGNCMKCKFHLNAVSQSRPFETRDRISYAQFIKHSLLDSTHQVSQRMHKTLLIHTEYLL